MNTVVLFSGGMDSTALLSWEVDQANRHGGRVYALSVNYGQRHVKEVQSAKQIAAALDVPHEVIDLSVLGKHLSSALTSPEVDVPDGHYAEETMRKTVVPNRNAIMLMVAGGFTSAIGFDVVKTAVHAGDHFIYPDCRPEFIRSASKTLNLGTEGFGDVVIEAPFVNSTKADIAIIGDMANAPFDLSWSCYKGGDIHCGACGTCFERREAFILADVTDPTVYAATPDYEAPDGVA